MSKNSEHVMRAQRRKKIDVVKHFGGKCCVCGYDRCINALEFHHVENKQESPSYVIMRWSWERAKKELEKCVLVCSNCHREIHYKVLDEKLVPQPRPFVQMECVRCGDPFETQDGRRKYCSESCYQMACRKCDRPTAAQLKTLIENHPFVKIGKMFGVSDNAVRKWAKAYNLLW